MSKTVASTSPVKGKTFWRSLDELADTPEFREHVEREFPSELSQVTDPLSRRKFIGLMGAAMAMSGLVGCRRPLAKILPYSKMPEDLLPGIPQFYATAMPFRGVAEPVLVKSNEGRPVKIEGNPEHPESRGATSVFAQASVLDLYDPDRSKHPRLEEDRKDWDEFRAWARTHFGGLRNNGGAGLRFLSEETASPAVRELRAAIGTMYPQAVWHTYEPLHRDHGIEGSRIAFGEPLRSQLDLNQADVVVALDSDFLYTEPNAVRHARDFSSRRRITSEKDGMNRLYMVESSFSTTGAMADHRLRLAQSAITGLLRSLAGELAGTHGVRIPGVGNLGRDGLDPAHQRFVQAVAKDLVRNRGRSVILVGASLPAEAHALAHGLNHALGNVGPVVRYTREPANGNQINEIRSLAGAMDRGEVDTLVILGGNPAFDAPADLNFTDGLKKTPHVIRAGLYDDETSALGEWHLPLAHYLEAWGDGEGWDGSLSIQQPLIAPLYEGRSELEILALLLNRSRRDGHDIVRRRFERVWGSEFESRWPRSLHDGFVTGSGEREVPVSGVDGPAIARALARASKTDAPTAAAMEVVFRPDHCVWDGRFSNNGWLQELPDLMSKITWDNAALMNPKTATEMGVASRDLVTVAAGGRELTLAAWIVPGLPDYCITIPMGYGRTDAGRIGSGVGFNTFALRTSGSSYSVHGAKVTKAGGEYPISSTQNQQSLEGRPLVREGSLEEYRKHPDFVEEMVEVPKAVTLYTDREYDFSEGYQWGMSIDLNTCIGCNACAIACQSENNIAIVGKDEVARGRVMHWIRIDRYYSGDPDEAEAVHQPVPCMQCENAPCESVCPVNATSHSDEGLNEMTYNRCIGTRYCNNNCPYKVRRFNYYNWRKDMVEVEKMAMNPDVTVRSRGVMEKCTYCVQRINRARIDAKNEDREIRDGDIQTACQQACPTGSIVFGNVNDAESRVSKLKKQNRDYAMLEEINTRPRTSYLARIRNLNPELEHA